ncbi:unnamed protein product [Darwinula stevensoni]|uniref:Uncharacterized protein n=1 Tax=Darwinula stevensoni TaxID=69355 RepID=A0A7R8XBD9_9CRUS|nr:unnamed protein product [Darwinula stevensoni]CAG0892733.1 unnamed protein product [Darwinula stevensoni]
MSSAKVPSERKRCLTLTVLVYSCAVLLTVVQALEYWRRYQTTLTVTTYRVEERWSFPAPKITLCRTPSFKKGLESSFDELNLSSFTKALGFSPKDILQSCKINGVNDACLPEEASPGDDIFHTKGKCRKQRHKKSRNWEHEL